MCGKGLMAKTEEWQIEEEEYLELLAIIGELRKSFPLTYALMVSMVKSHYNRVKTLGDKE